MVDRRRVRRLLQRIAEDLAFLEQRRLAERDALVGDPERMAAVKYVFVTAIEGCIDVAQHLCASEGWGPPLNNRDAVRRLAQHGVVPDGIGVATADAVGFRNVLVHGYVDVNDQRVADFLDRLAELTAYVDAVAKWTAEADGD